MRVMKKIFFVLLVLGVPVITHAQDDQKTTVSTTGGDEVRATEMADSVAKAELKKYQKEHPSRLTKFQLSLAHYTRSLNNDIKGGNGYFMFDYDYNQDLGGLVYMIHFSVMVNTKTGRTIFKAQEK